MKTKRKGIILIAAVICILLIAAIGIFALFGGGGELEPLDTSGSVASTTQNGDTIVFNPDGTYVIQGDVEIQGAVFAYEVKGTYAVNDGMLVLNEQNPTVYVDSKFGAFDLPGDIRAEIIDGALVVHLEASNESATFELAHFILGKEFAQMLGVTGITAGDWEDEPTQETEPEPTEEVTEPVLDAEGALLTVESAGNKIAFYPDDTFKLVGRFILEDSGLSVEYFYELTDTYSVEDGALILPEKATTLLNSDLFASYDYVDVETPSRCTAEIVDGLLELRFFIQVDSGEVEIAVFKLGKEDAEKIGVTGAEGDTVIEEEPEEKKPTGGNNAPSQPSIPGDAKPISYSSGGYTITFYSNGQYKQTGSVYVAGNTVSVSVTDTYTIDEEGNLAIRTSNQVSCYVSGYNLSFGAPNNSSCRTYGDGYKVSFDVYANGQNYHVGSVKLSADDIKQIQKNYGLEGETPDPEYSYIADTSKTVISFNKEKGTFSISGEGTLLIDGAENALTFTVSDTYTVAENGTATAANSANALSYKITVSGQTQEAKATPDVTIVKSGENYNITLKTTMFEAVFTLAEGTVSVGDVVIDDDTEQPEEPTPTGISATSNGITLSFYPSNNTFDLVGESKMGDTVLATYSLSAPGTYTIEDNVLKLSNVTLVVASDYAPGTFDIPGDQIAVAVNEDGTLSVTFPIGEPPVVFTYTKEQAEQIGLDMDVAEKPEVPAPIGISATSNGITLSFYPSSSTFDLVGESKMGDTVLATYSLSAPGTYTIEDNALKLSNVTLVVASDYAPGTFDIPGDQIAVAVNEDGTLSVTFPIGEPPVVFTYTKEQAEQIGLDMDATEEQPEAPAYTPDTSKTVISFNKENGFFTISGAGKFTVSGMEADLTFTAVDTYTVAEDGTVTAANTADALAYTVTMFGQPAEAKTTPVTSIVKDGDNYKVTLTATVNGQTLTLAEGTVSAEDVIKSEEPEAPAYTPDTSKTVISFNKKNGFFTISGAGKFTVSGMEADLTFTAVDTYTVAEDGVVTAANTADALAYTVTMFGQSEEAKTTPVTTIVKVGDNYKVTLAATVNGQTLTLAEGTVSADDVIKSEEPEAPAITYLSTSESITFNAEGKSFSANGSGTLSAMGMDMAITFTLNDSYAVAEDGTVTATNTPGALSYSVLGTPGSSNPITSITQSGDSYRIVISTEIAGFGIVTLLDETVNASNVVVNEVASVSEDEVLEDDGVEENSEEILAEEETDSEDPAITRTQDDQAEENPDDSVSDGAESPETEADSDAAEEVTDITESSETDSDTAEETTDTTTSDGTDTEGTVPEEADVSTEVE